VFRSTIERSRNRTAEANAANPAKSLRK
jgi:hypothetical protein